MSGREAWQLDEELANLTEETISKAIVNAGNIILDYSIGYVNQVFNGYDGSKQLYSVRNHVELFATMKEILNYFDLESQDIGGKDTIFQQGMQSKLIDMNTLEHVNGTNVQLTDLNDAHDINAPHIEYKLKKLVCQVSSSMFYYSKIYKYLVFIDCTQQINDHHAIRVFKSIDNNNIYMTDFKHKKLTRYRQLFFGYHIQSVGNNGRMRITFFGSQYVPPQIARSGVGLAQVVFENLANTLGAIKQTILRRRYTKLALHTTTDLAYQMAKSCALCHRAFPQVSLSKTFCKICGEFVCGKCSKDQLIESIENIEDRKFTIPDSNNRYMNIMPTIFKVRVCFACIETNHKGSSARERGFTKSQPSLQTDSSTKSSLDIGSMHTSSDENSNGVMEYIPSSPTVRKGYQRVSVQRPTSIDDYATTSAALHEQKPTISLFDSHTTTYLYNDTIAMAYNKHPLQQRKGLIEQNRKKISQEYARY